MKLADTRSPPILLCLLHLRQVQVAGAEEVGAAVSHFQLEFGIAAEVAQVVAGKGVAQGILLPAVGGGISHGATAPFFIIRCQSDFSHTSSEVFFIRAQRVFHSSRRELFHEEKPPRRWLAMKNKADALCEK